MVDHNHISENSQRGALNNSGFTFIEVVVVIIILGIMLTVATSNIDTALEVSRHQQTEEELNSLADAIVGNADLVSGGMRSDFGYVGDIGALPTSLADLVTAPGGFGTWNGPYVRDDFVENSNDYSTDPWGTSYVFTGGVTIQSTGSGSTVTKQIANSSAALLSTSVRGTILDRNGAPPGDSSARVPITITYPNGAGANTTSTVYPNGSGSYTFTGIPVGNHSLQAVYTVANDTVAALAGVLPTVGGYIDVLRLGGLYWSDTTSGGGGGGSGSIEYVSGSVNLDEEDIEFDIINTSSAAITVTSIVPTFTLPGVYFERVKWLGDKVYDEDCFSLDSGDTAPFDNAKTINAGQTRTMELGNATDEQGCDGDDVNIPSGTVFTITFSDGSVITVTAP